MTPAELQLQIDRASFAPDVRVSAYREATGIVFRALKRTEARRSGLEILLTSEACRMYGEGPMVATVLQQLGQRIDAGLPPLEEGGEYERLTFVGD